MYFVSHDMSEEENDHEHDVVHSLILSVHSQRREEMKTELSK